MKTLLKIWDALNGSKTTIGMIIVLVSQGVKVFAPGFLTPEQSDFIQSAGMVIGGGGLIHKGVKNKKLNIALTKLKQKKY